MIQFSNPLPLDVPICVEGHRPQMIETRGAPPGRRVAQICPSYYHFECAICRIATIPHISKAVAEVRWCEPDSPHRVPLHKLREAREQAFLMTNAA